MTEDHALKTVRSRTPEPGPADAHASRRGFNPLGWLDRHVILLVWAGVIVLFGVLRPDIFLTQLTVKTILADQAVTCALAVGLTFALAAGVIDLSFAAMAGLSMVIVTKLSITTSLGILPSALIAILACAALAMVTALLVTWLRVDSLIATLGMMSVATGLTAKLTAATTLTGQFSDSFAAFGQGYWGLFPRPFVYAVILGVVGYLVLEHTPSGRRILAVGSNIEAARLTGIRASGLQVTAILVSSTVAAAVGIVLAAKIGQATDTTGTGYLLPVIAAVFLGSTQFKGRVNVVGSLVSALAIGTGIKGLQLLGTTPWVADFFNGAVLLLAVAFAARRRRQ
jgi:ribose transport system permease protein